MTDKIEFSKLSGSGNDFICIDNRDGRFDGVISAPARASAFAMALCRRGLGIGADGLIFACDSEIEEVSDVQARFFEPDGSEAELCGNGTACFVHWLTSTGRLPQRELKILTPAGVVLGRDADGKYVRVCIPLPEHIQLGLTLTTDGQRAPGAPWGRPLGSLSDGADRQWTYDFAVTGVPHMVTYVDDLTKIDMPHWGPALRYHDKFQPRGVNVNFVQVLGEGNIAVRTWEFGVEGETLACGTGAAAAAVLAAMRFSWPQKFRTEEAPVLVKSTGGDTLRVYFSIDQAGTVGDLCLETIVRAIFQGTLSQEMAAIVLG
jgi:diaminopimelate epimerase